jgi:prepilin-type N-terminal cleavage/methylation domain-containing protein
MKSDPRAGFTLIEVLAGLFITGLFIVVVMPFITQLVGRAWSGQGNMAAADEWMRMDARLLADFGEAKPLSKGNGSNALVFDATPRHVKFLHRSLTGNRDDLELVTLSIESDPDGESLVRSAEPYHRVSSNGESDSEGDFTKVSLLKTPCDLHFAIPGQSLDEDRPANELPREIALEVENCALPGIPFIFPISARSDPVSIAAQTAQK